MINLEIKQPTNVTLYEAIQRTNGEGFDICDKDWDWGIYLGCEKSWEDCKDDWYYKCMLLFALNIVCEKINLKGFSRCRVADFITENIKAFTEFFNEENREGYRPCDYEKAQDSQSDEGFYEAYMQGMESLIAGNYSDSDYKKLYELIVEYSK